MQDLVILGTAGNSLEILDAVIAWNANGASPTHRVIGFLDDNEGVWATSIHGVPVLGGLKRVSELGHAVFVNGIGSTRTFMRKHLIIDSLGLPDDRFAKISHPSAVVSSFATVGAGSVLLQNVVVCSRAKVGRHVQVLPLSVISHDAVLDDFSTIAGGVCISGHVRVGPSSYIGSNASVREGVSIGNEALVAMGSVVLRDVEPRARIGGVPATALRKK